LTPGIVVKVVIGGVAAILSIVGLELTLEVVDGYLSIAISVFSLDAAVGGNNESRENPNNNNDYQKFDNGEA